MSATSKIRSTRSGREYSLYSVVTTPQHFDLSAALQQALLLENDSCDFDFDDFHASLPPDANIGGPLVTGPAPSDHGLGSEGDGSVGLEEGEILEDGNEPRQVAVGIGLGLEEAEVPPNAVLRPGRLARRRRHHERKKQAKLDTYGHLPSPKKPKPLHVQNALKVVVDARLDSMPFAAGGYQAVNLRKTAPRAPGTLQHYLDKGYTVVKHMPGITQPIVDTKTGKVIAVVVGGINDPSYANDAARAFDFIESRRAQINFTQDEKVHRRGAYPAVNYGISYGQGSKVPHWLLCRQSDVIEEILNNPHVQRLAKFASYVFATWAPNVYRYYQEHIDKLASKMPSLKWRFWTSIFLCTTFNFGPTVCTTRHRDFLNLPFGWCAIHALGCFDHTRGGHLVLHDLELVVELAAGSLALAPSALLEHSNIPVQPGERRISFTQFCAGGIFRYIDNGFKTEAQLDAPGRAKMYEGKAGRREMGIGLWSTLADLSAAHL